MGFLSDIQKFNAKLEQKVTDVFDGSVDESFRSIVYGSEITGAPALPVAPEGTPNAGKLRDSVAVDRVDETTAVISTDVDYAPDVEDDLKGQHFSSGGPHGWKLTAAGWHSVVDVVVAKVSDAG